MNRLSSLAPAGLFSKVKTLSARSACANRRMRRRPDKVAALLVVALASSFSSRVAISAGDLSACFQEDAATAISACSTFLESGDGSAGAKSQAYILRGNAYEKRGDYNKALKDFDSAIKIVPSNPIALYNRGNIETSLGQYDKAIDDYTQAIALDPQYARAFNNRCFAYNARGKRAEGPMTGDPQGKGVSDFEKAAADCRRAIALDPMQTKYFLGLGNALGSAGSTKDLHTAIENYDLAIRLDAQNSNAFVGRCNVDLKMNEFARAVTDCSEAIKLDKLDPIPWNNRCWARTIIGAELQEALSDCNEALKLQPNDPYVLDSRALTHLKSGRWDDAIADYDKALSFQRGRASSLYGRGLAKEKISEGSGKQDVEAAIAADSTISQKYRTYGVDSGTQ
ncbi:tetratricopeptide repeat protein [Bradyrhizobium sp. 18BD]